MSFSLPKGDSQSLQKAMRLLVPEVRADANIMQMGAIAGNMMGSFSNIIGGAAGLQQVLGAASSIPGVGQAVGKVQGALGQAQGAVNQVLSHANMVQGLFNGSPQQFLSGIAQFAPGVQKAAGLLGMLTSGSAGGAGLGFLGNVHKEFSLARKGEGAIAKLFQAPWAQLGPGVFAELMRIKKDFPNDRLIDLKKKGYKPKYAPGFWGQVTRMGNVDLMKTVAQNENWFWSQNWKKNGLSTPSHRTYPFAVFQSMMR